MYNQVITCYERNKINNKKGVKKDEKKFNETQHKNG